MKKFTVSVFVMLVLCIAVSGFAAQTFGTKEEAKKMVDKASAFIKANGKEKAFTEFNNKEGKFINKDLYIFAIDMKGNFLAHGGNAKMIGKNHIELQDADGKFLVKGLIETAKKGSGWYDYKWSNPVSKKIQEKTSFVQKMDDNLFIGCGAYK